MGGNSLWISAFFQFSRRVTIVRLLSARLTFKNELRPQPIHHNRCCRQARNIDALASNIENISVAVQNSANNTGEITEAVYELRSLTEKLSKLAGQFKVT